MRVPPPSTQILSGTAVLRGVRDSLAPYRDVIASTGRQVAIIRFEASADDPPVRRLRMEASRVSADQKVRAFEHVGLGVDHRVLPPTVSAAEFADLIAAHNADPRTAATIVQYPPPPRLTALVQGLAADKDIDALLEDRSPHRACATADGIVRLVTPFIADQPSIAVVGARGFVGSGVVRLLSDAGQSVTSLDAGDDLRAARDADIVVSTTGQPHLLTAEHIRPHHRLVVDSGFMPQFDGTVAGDVHPSASQIPQIITPVPGGVGPVEMAVLMERIVKQEVDASLPSWSVGPMPYLSRTQATRLAKRGASAAKPRSAFDAEISARTARQADDDQIRLPGPTVDDERGGRAL